MNAEISDARMAQMISRAKDAATIYDNQSGGMGLAPRAPTFSEEVYRVTLDQLIQLEREKIFEQSEEKLK